MHPINSLKGDLIVLPSTSTRAKNAASASLPHLDLAVIALLPDPVRRVETDRLEEEHQRHPLVIRVVDPLVVVAVRA